jgi:hypothetical protein
MKDVFRTEDILKGLSFVKLSPYNALIFISYGIQHHLPLNPQ